MWRRTSTISLSHSQLVRAGIGLIFAALAQILGLFLAGAGHGWVAPLFLSVGLWFLIPLAFAVTWPAAPARRPVLLLMAAIALTADALLFSRTLGEASALRSYLTVNGVVGWTIVASWLCLWLCWQVLILYSLTSRHAYD